jgi:hypothetical protein
LTWLPIQDDDIPVDEGTLSAGFGTDLEVNADHVLANRLKRHSVTYPLGPTSTSGGTPPVGDSTLVGPTLPVAGSSASDPEAIGLKLSSPPTTPIVRRLGTWPLSARATSIRVVVGCTTTTADVDLYAVAVINGQVTPAHPMHHLISDSDGLVGFDSAVTASSSYARVGTSTPAAGTQNAKPVVLTIDLGSAPRTDYGFHGPPDASRVCSVFLCILSREGALDGVQSQSSVAEFEESGRRLTTATALSNWPVNPGPLHRWLKFPSNGDDAVLRTADAWLPRWRGVVQLRPTDMDNPGTSNAVFVVHPPIELTSAIRTDADFEIYTCGTITIHSTTVQEVGT